MAGEDAPSALQRGWGHTSLRSAVPLSRLVAGGPLLHMNDLGGTLHRERLEVPVHLPPGHS
eukprot:6562044-Karenia_brevis.AAC.1